MPRWSILVVGLVLAILPGVVADASFDVGTAVFVLAWWLPFVLLAGLAAGMAPLAVKVTFGVLAAAYLGIVAAFAVDDSSTAALGLLWLTPAGFVVVALGAAAGALLARQPRTP